MGNLMAEVRMVLPYLEKMDWNKCLHIFLSARNDDNTEDHYLEGKSFTPQEALEFAIKLAEAAIPLLAQEELEAIKNDHKRRD